MDGQRRGPRLTYKTMFVLGAMNMIDCINVNLLTPYVDRMMSTFLDVDPDNPKVARNVGLLIGLYSLCEVCFSVVWGTMADRVGRKPALLIGLGGSVFAPIMFGLGSNLTVVFIARGLDGFFCGNMGVTRTYMGEIVDETNEARGFSLLAVCFSLGLFIGPILGGELVYPADFAPSIFKGTIFDTHPFLLPNLTYAIFAAIAWVIGFICLEETLPYEERRGICGFFGGLGREEDAGPVAAADQSDRTHSSPTPYARSRSTHRTSSGPSPSGRSISRQCSGTDPMGRPCWEPTPRVEATDLLDPQPAGAAGGLMYPAPLLQCIISYCAIGGYSSAAVQLFVLIVSFPRDRDGFALDPAQIGLLQNVAAVGLLLTQLFVFPWLTRKAGFFWSFFMGWSLQVLTQLLFPIYGLFADPETYHGWRFVPLCFMQFFGAVGNGFLFPTAFALINRAAEGLEKGAVNGWANSSGALCRAVFPPAAGLILGFTSKSSVEFFRYIAVYVNCLVGTALLLIAAPGMYKTEQERARKVRLMQQHERDGTTGGGGAAAAAVGGASSARQPLVEE